MVFGMIMRNSKIRTALYAFVAIGMCLTIYMLHSTHDQLNDTKNQYDACQQQKDSLLAQMQVVYEQKNRVEKSLQQERQEHKQAKVEQQKSNELRILTEKDKREVESKYTELQKDLQSLEEKKQHLETQLSQLQESQSQKEEEKKQLQADLVAQLKELQNAKDQEIDRLKGQIGTLQAEKEKLQQQNQVQDWELNQQVAKLQFCQSKQSELEKQLLAVHSNSSPDVILRPGVQYLHEPTKKSDSPKEAERQQIANNGGGGINGASPPATNNVPVVDKQIRLPANGVVAASSNNSQPLLAPKMAAESMDQGVVKPGVVGDGGGGDILPVEHAKVSNTAVPPLKMPLAERTTRKVLPLDEGLHNPAGLQEQIQPPNSAIVNGKKQEDERDVADFGRENLALHDLRPHAINQVADSGMMAEQQRNLGVENHLVRPYLGPDRPIIPQHFLGGNKRVPQFPINHNQGHLNHFKDMNNDYVDEGKDGLK